MKIENMKNENWELSSEGVHNYLSTFPKYVAYNQMDQDYFSDAYGGVETFSHLKKSRPVSMIRYATFSEGSSAPRFCPSRGKGEVPT